MTQWPLIFGLIFTLRTQQPEAARARENHPRNASYTTPTADNEHVLIPHRRLIKNMVTEKGWAGLARGEHHQWRRDQHLPSPGQSLLVQSLAQLGTAWRLEPKKTKTFRMTKHVFSGGCLRCFPGWCSSGRLSFRRKRLNVMS
jgi:hypothetical protein